jgi:lipopolysaccharide transport system ATP-binding protein
MSRDGTNLGEDPSPCGNSNGREILLEASNVSKRFCRDYRRSLFYGARDIVGLLVNRPYPSNQLREKEFWALQNVSFTLSRGEAVGIVGKNGSGKTTLLRILAGLIHPTTGSVVRKGRLAPMLALGAGFNPVLTGRENIYVNMSILGLSKEEIDARFEEVVSFAEIRESLDSPVQNYSSGMSARLGFACAIHTSPDILLIDEVMAVGDIAFQKKCQRRLMEMRERGTSFIIVNHAPQMIVDTCQAALYLQDSRCKMAGNAMQVIRSYEEDMRLGSVARPLADATDSQADEAPSHDIKIVSCKWTNLDGAELVSGGRVTMTIGLQALRARKAAAIMLRIEPAVEIQQLHWKEVRAGLAQAASVLVASSAQDGLLVPELVEGFSQIGLDLTPLGLAPGHYRCLVWLFSSRDAVNADLLDLNTSYFDVMGSESMQGSNYFQHRQWSFSSSASLQDESKIEGCVN